jgi:hypothetical protein
MRIINPKRVTRSYTQSLLGTPEEVFPLLCPVRETEWVAGWAPGEVRSASGLAELDCVFTTPTDSGEAATWIITRHDPVGHIIQFVKLTPSVTACRLDITVRPEGGGSHAEIAYTHTSLGPRGDGFVDAFTTKYYEAFMSVWQDSLNAYLAAARSKVAG